MTKLEEIARAMWEVVREDANAVDIELEEWDDEPQALRDDWIANARAAVEAMREPSENELDAFARAFGWKAQTADGRENAKHAWQAMIGTILSETSDEPG
jgi:hypothetical protein